MQLIVVFFDVPFVISSHYISLFISSKVLFVKINSVIIFFLKTAMSSYSKYFAHDVKLNKFRICLPAADTAGAQSASRPRDPAFTPIGAEEPG